MIKKEKEKIKVKEKAEDVKKINKSTRKTLMFVIYLVFIVVAFGFGYLFSQKEDKKENIKEDKSKTFEEKSIYAPDSEIANKTEEEKLKYYFTDRKVLTRYEFEKTLEKGKDNDTIVRNDIKRLFAYLNGEVGTYSPEADMSSMLMSLYELEEPGVDLIELKGMYLMECVYDIKFVDIPNLTGGYKIVSQKDYDIMKDYFDKVPSLQPYDEFFKERWGDDFESSDVYLKSDPHKEMYDHGVNYLNKNYYVVYEYGDGYGTPDCYYEIEDIIKKSETEYEVSYNFYYHYSDENKKDIYFKGLVGTLKVEVINNHLKYYPSILKEAK